MPAGTAALGFLGVAMEVTPGTYVAPTKFFPIRNETLQFMQDEQWRRVVRGIADTPGAVVGNSHVEGDIEMELLSDVLPWFLRCSRQTVVKSGAGPYVYTFTPSHAAQAPDKTLSITVVRNGVVSGYTGMIVSSYVIGVDNGVATFKASLVGIDEATQATPTLSLVNQTPFGPGQYSIEVPTATPVSDTDTFTFEVNDNADPQFRLRAVRTPAWIKYGEREVKLTLERDFLDRTELDAFKALTATSVTVKATKGAGESVAVKLAGGVRDEYTINGLTGQGDVERATVVWQGAYDAGTSKAYEIIVTTPTENIP